MDVKGLKHAVLATCVIAAAAAATGAGAAPPSPAAAAAFEQGLREDAARIGDATGVTPQAALARL